MLCRNCDTEFTPTRAWQLFCRDACKKNYNIANRETCFYCGVSGNHRDHIHPVSFRGGVRVFRVQEHVFSCAECNGTLSDTMFDNVVERLDYLIKAYQNKYKKELAAKPWEEIDLEEMGPRLRASIKGSMKKRNDVEMRLKYLFNVQHSLMQAIENNKET